MISYTGLTADVIVLSVKAEGVTRPEALMYHSIAMSHFRIRVYTIHVGISNSFCKLKDEGRKGRINVGSRKK
jgi:hypothetical protein